MWSTNADCLPDPANRYDLARDLPSNAPCSPVSQSTVPTVMATCIIRSKKEPFKTANDHLSPGCKHRRVGVQSEIVDSLLLLEKRHIHVMEKIVYGWCFYPCAGYLAYPYLQSENWAQFLKQFQVFHRGKGDQRN